MGNLTSLYNSLFGYGQVKFLMVGLDAAGKTTILYKLKLGEVVTTIPTASFTVERVEYKNISFTSWDLGENDEILQQTSEYLQNVKGLIFVVDSNDRGRFNQAKKELFRMLGVNSLWDATLLVFANKQDLSEAANAAEITDMMGLYSLRNRNWFVQPTSAILGDGLYEGLDWLSQQINNANE